MKKQPVFIIVLVVLLTLLALKFMFNDEKPSLFDAPTSADNRPPEPQPVKPISKVIPKTQHDESPGVDTPAKLASEVVAGGGRWKLNFADDSLPAEARQRVGYDVNLIFAHLSKFEVDVLPFPIEIDGKRLDRRVRFEGGTNRRPDILVNSGFGHLESGADESSLFIPKSVIAEYSKAVDREKQNSAAYQTLDRFLARMSELKEKPVENVRDFFVLADDFKSAEADLAAVTPSGFAEGWGGKLYREPSILDVKETAGTPLEKYGSLVATTYAMSEGKVDDLPLLLFSNGQWRFLLQRPPT
jgi:hypothetical protein